MQQGILIAFDGPKGAGKTTLVNGVKENLSMMLKGSGRELWATAQPTKPFPGNKRDPDETLSVNKQIEWFTRDRGDQYGDILCELLEHRAIVLLDRHYLSTVVHQGYLQTGGYRRACAILARQQQLFGKPDLWVLVQAPVKEVCARLAARKEEGQQVTMKVAKQRYDAYRKMAQHLGAPTIKVNNKDGTLEGNVFSISNAIFEMVRSQYPNKREW